MRLTVLGGCGGWPAAGLACSGYLVEHDGFRLLIDPGYAIAAPAAGGRGRGRGGCRAGQPRAPGPLRRPEPAAPGQGHARRAAPGAARVRAAGRARAGARAGPPGHAGRRDRAARVHAGRPAGGRAVRRAQLAAPALGAERRAATGGGRPGAGLHRRQRAEPAAGRTRPRRRHLPGRGHRPVAGGRAARPATCPAPGRPARSPARPGPGGSCSPTCGRAPTRRKRCGPRPGAIPARSPSPPPGWSPSPVPGENEPVTGDCGRPSYGQRCWPRRGRR